VVGAAGETDLDILSATQYLQRSAQISRAYFSSFNPIQGTPLEDLPPSPSTRELRLYQASYLLRDFGFSLEELVYKQSGNLSLNEDPKLAWANRHLKHRPVEVNTASRSALLRVPGLGPTRVDKILIQRRQGKIKSFAQLRKNHLADLKSAPFLLFNGKRAAQQARLF
jgi:predicted DNA-binding helix-hairpin-helix protein